MATGAELLELAARHLGQRYVLGVKVPKDNPNWTGPWDCAEFASWCVYQASRKIFGCDQAKNPSTADAYTGYWRADAKRLACSVPIVVAKSTPGAFVLRYPAPRLNGHIAMCDGAGGTIEAHSAARGVMRAEVDGRRWDVGVLPPMIHYDEPSVWRPYQTAGLVLRLKTPNMKGALVARLQAELNLRGFRTGAVDGVFGPHTAAAVYAFQLSQQLVADGEAGRATLRALGLRS
jgi:N-acetylmuramoyl-L-alanine amidase